MKEASPKLPEQQRKGAQHRDTYTALTNLQFDEADMARQLRFINREISSEVMLREIMEDARRKIKAALGEPRSSPSA